MSARGGGVAATCAGESPHLCTIKVTALTPARLGRDAAYNHPLRPNRLTLAIEVMQGQRPAAGERGHRLFAAMGNSDPLHVKLWVGIPRGVSTEMDRKSIRESLLRSSSGSEHTHWVRIFQTEPRKPSQVAPGRFAISFAVMPSIDTEIVLADHTVVPTEGVRLRLDLCTGDNTQLGWMACGISEFLHLDGGRMVKALSDDMHELRGEVSRDEMRFTMGDAARYDEGEGVNIGVGVFYPPTQPSQGALHDVCTQSYMLPVVNTSQRVHQAPPVFAERPLRCPEQGNAIVATEHLLLPRAGMEVPAAYLHQQVEAMRSDLRAKLADVGVNMRPEGSPTPDSGDSDEDEFDTAGVGFAASRGPAAVMAAATDANLEANLATMQSTQMQLKRFLEVAPWYGQVSEFMRMLALQHGSEASAGGRRDLFFRRSKFKKEREWAFTAINMMQYTITVPHPSGTVLSLLLCVTPSATARRSTTSVQA